MRSYHYDLQKRIFTCPDHREFPYSDGAAVEERLLSVIKHTTDVSSSSHELVNAIADSPSEYHLSPVRHNLFRFLGLWPKHRILELSAGFNPEFTGRENVYFQGTLTGFTKAQMDKRFADVAAFADIGEFIDQPVRIYSSGMILRLAFAAAIHADPDILVIDEALAVGDMAFQRKCFAQIDRIRDAGCTIIFVSHDMGAITSHCNRALLLDRGQSAMSGPPKPLADRYLASAIARLPAGDGTTSLTARDHDPGLAPMSTLVYPQHGAEITSPRILTPEGEVTNLLRRGKEYDYIYDIRFDAAADDIRCGMLIKTPDGRELGGLTSATPGAGLKTALGMRYCQKFRFRCNFLPGTYFINAGVVGPDGSYLHRIIDATMFVVLPESDLCCTGCVDISPARKPQ